MPTATPRDGAKRLSRAARSGHTEAHHIAGSFDPWPLAEWQSRAGTGVEYSTEWLRLHEEYERAAASWSGSDMLRSPLRQLCAAEACMLLKPLVEAGSGPSVMEAIAHCARHGLVIPPWLSDAFYSRYAKVATGQSREWSDSAAFGSPHLTGVNKNGVRKWFASVTAYRLATEVLAEDPRQSQECLEEAVSNRMPFSYKARSVRAAIKERVGRNPSEAPPLDIVRKGLLAGLSLPEVMSSYSREWWRPHLEAAGFVKFDKTTEPHKATGQPLAKSRKVSAVT